MLDFVTDRFLTHVEEFLIKARLSPIESSKSNYLVHLERG